MSSNLYAAHQNWANRPNDERFKDLKSLHDFTVQKREASKQTTKPLSFFNAAVADASLVLESGKRKFEMTNWSFTQLCSRLGMKPTAFTDFPPELISPLINYKFTERIKGLVADEDSESDYKFLIDTSDENSRTIRAINGTAYCRVWDYQIVEKLMELEPQGWTVPPAMETNWKGEKVDASGLYCGDRDMFVFMVNENSRIKDGTDQGLARGFFIGNSEVGAAAYYITSFLYRYVCGNHIVWDVNDVEKISIRHVGNADQKAMAALAIELDEYADSSTRKLEASIKLAQEFRIGKDAEEVEDILFRKHRILPKKTIVAALESAEVYADIDGDPFSAWGITQGLTRVSQEAEYASARITIDKAANRVLQMAM